MQRTKQLVDVVAVTVDPPATNRKIAKKSRIQFPVLSDEAGEWMLAYRVTQGGLRENMAFLIEPDLGRVSEEPSAMVLPVGASGFTWRGLGGRTYIQQDAFLFLP